MSNLLLQYKCWYCGSIRWVSIDPLVAMQTNRFACLICQKSAYVEYCANNQSFKITGLIIPGSMDDPAHLRYADPRWKFYV